METFISHSFESVSVQDDYSFFRQVVLNISSSLDLSKSLRATFDFLSRHFPVDAMTLHTFAPRLRALHLLFLVTQERFYALDETIPLSEDGVQQLNHIEFHPDILNLPRCNERPVAGRHNRAISEFLPYKDRAYLIALLSSGDEIVGHLCLIGTKTNCFKDTHEHKLRLMVPPISLAMLNMLQYRRTVELQSRLDEQRRRLAGEVSLLKESAIVGAKGGLRETMEMVGQLAGKEIPVLILGETGTGKELIADTVQRISPRSDAPYVKVNCGAIPDSLVDSELFGYEKGAFTGADTSRPGRFEQADGGTLFLDEVGELPPQAQVRLLRVLQNGIVDRVGSSKSIPVDVRVIAATHRNLEGMLQDGRFREDLFYRLNVFPVNIPPLRERSQDIAMLVRHFMGDAARRLKLSNELKLAHGTIERLQAYSWPGNIRELKNLIERALTLDPKGPIKLDAYLPRDLGPYLSSRQGETYLKQLVEKHVEKILKHSPAKESLWDLDGAQGKRDAKVASLDDVITTHIKMAIDLCRGKIHGPGGAAEALGVHPSTLRKRMDKLGIVYGRRWRYQTGREIR